MRALAPLLLLLLVFRPAAPSPPSTSSGWSAAERFIGLRFECAGDFAGRRAFALALRDLADELRAFGWVQVARNGTGAVVGEFRGVHSTAALCEDVLRRGPPGADAQPQ